MLSLERAGQGEEPQDREGPLTNAGKERQRPGKAGLMQEEGWKQAVDWAVEPLLLAC